MGSVSLGCVSVGSEILSNEVLTDTSLTAGLRISGASMLDRTKQLLDKLLVTKSAVLAHQ